MNFSLFSTTYLSHLFKTLILILWLTLITSLSWAQSDILQKRISIQVNDVTLAQALEQIEEKAGCTFIYSLNLLDAGRKVSLNHRDETLERVLQDVFGDAVKRMEIKGNRINLQPSAGKGTVSGTVRTSDGQPAGFVTVSIRGQRSTQADERGGFKLENIEAGTYTVVASYVGLQTQQQRVTVAPDGTANVAFTLSEDAQTLQEVEVTGQQRKTSSVTKTDIPLENLPMMVQIIDQAQLQRRQVLSIREAIANVSGINYASSYSGGYDAFSGRGFELTAMRNGVSIANGAGQLYGDNIEQIDVLKGPASIQYGDLPPGSVINLVTKKPLEQNYTRFEMKLGQYSLLRPTFDISGALDENRTVLFRLNTTLEKANSFRDEINNRTFLFAPTITWKITDRLTWNVEAVYSNDERTSDPGIISPNQTYDGLQRLRFETFLGEPANM
ncbi:TonB-dependent receptor [Parapedobacter koreensis]|uniref:Iron complex outermembrane recepter protein n=1 Tax=Parapedobacter koreensis TaxID=332977 RepID=A0A1H7JUK2_9SPHI|nr:TonB-dependent receptor [Parapedobacter koreensis]SEK78263.1 iron complex outermembrane recepter protein [Parapedobacter koreensis]